MGSKFKEPTTFQPFKPFTLLGFKYPFGLSSIRPLSLPRTRLAADFQSLIDFGTDCEKMFRARSDWWKMRNRFAALTRYPRVDAK